MKMGSLAQVLASFTSVIYLLTAAQLLSLKDFGALGIAASTVALGVGLSRGYFTEPFVYEVRVSSISAIPTRTWASPLVAGIPLFCVLVALGSLAGSNIMIASAVMLLGVQCQDHVRTLLVIAGRGRSALFVEMLCFVGPVLVLSLDRYGYAISASTILITWGAASAAASLVGLSVRVAARAEPATSVVLVHWRRSALFSADYAVSNALPWLALIFVSQLESIEQAGALRGAQLLMAPILLLARAGLLVLGPRARHLAEDYPSRVPALALRFAVSLALLSGVLGASVLLLPASALTYVLGDTAAAATALVPWVALAVISSVLAMSSGLVLRAHLMISSALRIRTTLLVPAAALMAVLVTSLGAVGSQLALASTDAVRSALNLQLLRKR